MTSLAMESRAERIRDAHRGGDGYPWPSGAQSVDQFPVRGVVNWHDVMHGPAFRWPEHEPWVCPHGLCVATGDTEGRCSAYAPYYAVIEVYGPGDRWGRCFAFASPRAADELRCGLRHWYRGAVEIHGPHATECVEAAGAVAGCNWTLHRGRRVPR